MGRVSAKLTVDYLIEVEVDGTPTPEKGLELLEEAYADGELGIVDDHEFSDVEVLS